VKAGAVILSRVQFQPSRSERSMARVFAIRVQTGLFECRGTQMIDVRDFDATCNCLNRQVQCRGTDSIEVSDLSSC